MPAIRSLVSTGRIIGTLSFGTRNRPTFTAEELELMKTVADQVAIAIERKQTGEKISQLNRELKHTVEELEAVFDTVPIGIAIAEDPQGFHIEVIRLTSSYWE